MRRARRWAAAGWWYRRRLPRDSWRFVRWLPGGLYRWLWGNWRYLLAASIILLGMKLYGLSVEFEWVGLFTVAVGVSMSLYWRPDHGTAPNEARTKVDKFIHHHAQVFPTLSTVKMQQPTRVICEAGVVRATFIFEAPKVLKRAAVEFIMAHMRGIMTEVVEANILVVTDHCDDPDCRIHYAFLLYVPEDVIEQQHRDAAPTAPAKPPTAPGPDVPDVFRTAFDESSDTAEGAR